MMTAPQSVEGHQHHRHVDGGDYVTVPTLSRHDLHIAKSRSCYALLLHLPFAPVIPDCIFKCLY